MIASPQKGVKRKSRLEMGCPPPLAVLRPLPSLGAFSHEKAFALWQILTSNCGLYLRSPSEHHNMQVVYAEKVHSANGSSRAPAIDTPPNHALESEKRAGPESGAERGRGCG